MEYFLYIATLVSIYSILTLSLNLVVGETGLLSISQAAFFGIGAYATALLVLTGGYNFLIATFLAMLLAGLGALVLGIVFSRLEDDYYALGSFGFNVIVYGILLNWQSVTQGPLGIPGIPRPFIFGVQLSDNLSFFILSFVCAILVYAACRSISHSSFGRTLHAIREDKIATRIFGYETLHYVLTVSVISAIFAALAGALFASFITFIDPTSFALSESILILSMVILGGLASNRGAVLGAAILVMLPEALRFAGLPDSLAAEMRQALYGLLLVLLMLYRPQGLLGIFKL